MSIAMSWGRSAPGDTHHVEQLARAAARAAGDRGAIAVVRGFNRDVRQRSRFLRDLLIADGTPAFEVTPMTALRGLDPAAAVADITRGGSPGAHQVAARLGVPLIAPAEDGPTTTTEHDVIGIRHDDWFDAAFDSVRLMSEGPRTAALTVSMPDGSAAHEVAGDILIQLADGDLRVLLGGQAVTGERLVIRGSAGHRVLRDGMPVAELHGDLEITAESRHYPVTLVGH